MYKKGLVNILTPTHNCTQYITRLLDSVLSQTYPNVEMYVIDNESTDETPEVMKRYIRSFAERGYTLHYIYQEDGGSPKALNNGLKLVTGEYLLWSDADDWYKSTKAIETFVNTLSQYGDEVGMVRCQFESIDADTMEVIDKTSFNPCDTPIAISFEDAMHCHNFAYIPIEYALKAKFLDEYIIDREIYVNKLVGANAQILWPYIANTKCVTIDEVLGYYLVRNNSESHKKRSYEDWMALKSEVFRLAEHTILSIETLDTERKEQLIYDRKQYVLMTMIELDIQFNKTKEFRNHYRQCIEQKIILPKRYKKVWWWTCLFSIQSYKGTQKIIREFFSRNKEISK